MKALVLAALVAAALLSATAASAAPKRWSQMTLEAKRTLLVQTVRQDRATVRWWISRRQAAGSKQVPLGGDELFLPIPLPTRRCTSIGIAAPDFVCLRAAEMRHALGVLANVEAKIAAAAFPPHHALWMCIHGHEGRWDDPNSGGNGHYGGLQMHPGWGYGTSYYANQDSQIVQEQSAERGYRASGYSRSWLLGQWYHPDCLAYA